VVHGTDRPSPKLDRIVVGIDGSACSDEALRWAVDTAARTGAELELVHAWSYPYPSARHGASDPRHEMRLDAMRMLESAERSARDQCMQVRVHSVVSEDNPAKALIDAGRSADLVVVGSRGRGGFAALLLGSTSRTVLQHASVPVALVRPAA
jgi:nucleotide-binding universal stress UspA family protein